MSDQDLPLLVEMFSFLHFCSPPNLMEAVKLGTFYEKLLEDNNAKTLLLATINNMLVGNIKSKHNKDVLDKIFDKLDKIYNFMLGPAVLAFSSTPQLRQLAKEEEKPFLEDYSRDIQHCLHHPQCERLVELTNGKAKH